MRYANNNKGIALITALMFTVISLLIIIVIIYIVTQGVVISGFQKRYETALDASHGGLEIVTKEFIPQIIRDASDPNGAVSSIALSNYVTNQLSGYTYYQAMITRQATDACFTDKLTKLTNNWNGACDKQVDNLRTAFDVSFRLNGMAGRPNFVVYTKIVDTVPGNTSTSGIELEGDAVVGTSAVLSPPHKPYQYRIEVRAEREANPDENSNLSALYLF